MEKKNYGINVYSEIGLLKTVLLHRPGDELINLAPNLLAKMLFDDTPDLVIAQKEHDAFAKTFKDLGVEVLYIEKLVAEILDHNSSIKTQLIKQFLKEAEIKAEYVDKINIYLQTLDNQTMINKMIAGITKYELKIAMLLGDYPLVVDPMPNILFQRDPFASIGNGATINRMLTVTRNRETLFSDIILKYHPRFKGKINYWYNRNEKEPLEGGDILVLNKETIIIGASQRTTINAIKKIAQNLFNSTNNSFKKVVVIDLKTKNRAFMHLDTVFSHIDVDKFLVHPLIFSHSDEFAIFEITKNAMTEIKTTFLDYLTKIINKPIIFLKCGGDDPIAQAREQWNDGTNVITVKPGEVIAYARNHITIAILKKAGIKVHVIASSELSRGRGGPRCMAMPIWREDL